MAITEPLAEFGSNEEERLIRDSVHRMVQENRKPVVLDGKICAPGNHARAYLRALEALGLSELIVSDKRVDIASIRRIAIISEEAGAGLYLAPVAESLGLSLLQAAGLTERNDTQHSQGVTLTALGDPFAGTAILPVARSAEAGQLRVSGKLSRVPFAPLAAQFVALAANEAGVQLLRIPADARGVSVAAESMADGTQRGEIAFDNCLVSRDDQIASDRQAAQGAALLVDVMLLSTAAQLAGIAARAQQMAAEHLLTRHQFGRPLAAFQALQHRAANDYVGVEVVRAFLYQMCDYWDEEATRRTLLHALMAKASQTAIDTAKSAIQCFGAMGFTSEHEIGWQLRAAVTLSTRYGGLATHRRLFAEGNIAFW